VWTSSCHADGFSLLCETRDAAEVSSRSCPSGAYTCTRVATPGYISFCTSEAWKCPDRASSSARPRSCRQSTAAAKSVRATARAAREPHSSSPLRANIYHVSIATSRRRPRPAPGARGRTWSPSRRGGSGRGADRLVDLPCISAVSVRVVGALDVARRSSKKSAATASGDRAEHGVLAAEETARWKRRS